MIGRSGYEQRFKDENDNVVTPHLEPGPVSKILIGTLMFVPVIILGLIKGFVGLAIIRGVIDRHK